MAKYSRFDQRNKKKRNDKYRSDKKFISSKPKNNVKYTEIYNEEIDIPSLRGWQKT